MNPARRRAGIKSHKETEKVKQNTSGVQKDIKMLDKNKKQVFKVAADFVGVHMQVWCEDVVLMLQHTEFKFLDI